MDDWPTIVIAAIILAAFLAVVIVGIRNKKKGKGGCSCGCSDCAMKGSCHSQQK